MPAFPRLPRRGVLVLAALLTCAALGLDGNAAAGHVPSSAPVTASAASATTKTQPQSLLVTTDKGQLEGRTTGPVDQFLGIPYAQPPVGSLRWAAPSPMTAWTGVRSALSYGNRCPQPSNGNGPRVDTEDCLYLNVFTPSYVPASGKLPVMFMIHGGGLTTGAGDQQDGSLLAQTQNIIVVSINYRLGPFGFLDLPGLSNGSGTDGNFGLLDQEAALRWTSANISAFGGDPSKVTIAGESAGGWSVCALLTSPGARGLFARAVMESGSCASQSAVTARTASLSYAAKAGCTDATSAAACLRAKPESALLDASDAGSAYQPAFIAGGSDLPVAPATAVATGKYAKVPILFGDNHDEGRTFTQGFAAYTEQQYESYVDTTYGSLAPQILARYPWSAYPAPYTAAYALGAIDTDSGAVAGIGGCTAQNLADQFAATTRTYFFQFDDRDAPGLNNSLPGYQWGAGHAMELAYLWPSFTNGYSLYAEFTPAQLELSREMLDSWGAFVRTGSPDTAKWPAWPTLSGSGAGGGASGGQALVMSLRPGGQSRLISGAQYGAEHQCTFWDTEEN